MAAVTQPFIYGEFLIYLNTGLSTIQQGEIINSLRAVREDIIKTAYAAYLMELTDKLLDSRDPDPYLYDQLYLTMCWISENEDAEIPMIMYELKLFRKGGFAPTVDRCVHCGSNEAAPFAFSIGEGGLLCNNCRHLDNEALFLPQPLAKLLHLFSSVGIDRIGTISVKKENKELLRRILDAYYEQYGGYYLKT